jgi:hypothetical protein
MRVGRRYHPAVRFDLLQRIRAPLEAVEAAYVDPGFLRDLAALPELGSPELLEQEDRGDEFWQRVRYAFVGDLSSAVRRVVDPDRLTWVEESTLDRATHQTALRIVPDYYGRLLEASGKISLEPDGADPRVTRRRALGDLVVHVPLLGRKVETAIVSGLQDHADKEVELVERWAAKHR